MRVTRPTLLTIVPAAALLAACGGAQPAADPEQSLVSFIELVADEDYAEACLLTASQGDGDPAVVTEGSESFDPCLAVLPTYHEIFTAEGGTATLDRQRTVEAEGGSATVTIEGGSTFRLAEIDGHWYVTDL